MNDRVCVICHKNKLKKSTDLICDECSKKMDATAIIPAAEKVISEAETDLHVNKKDQGKLAWHLLSEDMLEDVVKVLMFGREKYAEDTWQHVGPDEYGNPPLVRYQDALKRHLAAFNRGETVDAESGLPALAHVACNALFIAWLEKHPECNQSGPDIHKQFKK